MKFLSIDQHIAVCADVRHIFNNMGHVIREVSLSGHAPVIGRPVGDVPMLTGDNWCSTISGRKFKEFFEMYKNDLKDYDGFLCCYPPIFSMLYKYCTQPIIIHIPIRYECGADNNPELWEEFNEFLRKGVDEGRIFLTANSLYDQEYAQGFIGRIVQYIPSLCEYTGMSYNPVYGQYLFYSSFDIHDKSGRMVKKHSALKAGHAWQTVADFRGCVHYPYNVSTMSIFEQYTAGIPLFFPTKRYLLEMLLSGVPVLHQISWQQSAPNGQSRSLIKHNFTHDPNNWTDYNCVEHWLKYADYYSGVLPGIQYFDTPDDRNKLLDMPFSNLLSISKEMRNKNKERKELIYDKWSSLLHEVTFYLRQAR